MRRRIETHRVVTRETLIGRYQFSSEGRNAGGAIAGAGKTSDGLPGKSPVIGADLSDQSFPRNRIRTDWLAQHRVGSDSRLEFH